AGERPDPVHDEGRPVSAVDANPPGRPALTYRAGTHATFLRSMLADLPGETIADGPNHGTRPLAALRTRASDDASIALLDAGATVLDVLTFYQERIANEGFLRTVTERRSLLELARAIGYELRPGVAAGAYLAFTVEDAEGAPGQVTVPAGTPVQSIPAQGKQAQTFETTEEIEARAAWNALRARSTRPQALVIDNGVLELEDTDGTSTEAKQLYLDGTETGLRQGDLLLAALRRTPDAPLYTATGTVHRVEVDAVRQRTLVYLAAEADVPAYRPIERFAQRGVEPIGLGEDISGVLAGGLHGADVDVLLEMSGSTFAELAAAWQPPKPPVTPEEGVFAFRARAGFFGHNAPLHSSLPTKADGSAFYPNDWDSGEATTIWTDSAAHENPDAAVYLERIVPEVVGASWLVFTAPSGRR